MAAWVGASGWRCWGRGGQVGGNFLDVGVGTCDGERSEVRGGDAGVERFRADGIALVD